VGGVFAFWNETVNGVDRGCYNQSGGFPFSFGSVHFIGAVDLPVAVMGFCRIFVTVWLILIRVLPIKF
jgi:hypothetical protein